MHTTPNTRWRLTASTAVLAVVLTGCTRASETAASSSSSSSSAAATSSAAGSSSAAPDSSAAGSTPAGGDAAGGCVDVLAAAKTAVAAAADNSNPWSGPTTGPKAEANKLIVYVASTMTNPGVAGVAAGVQEAGAAIGWEVRVLDGQGDQATTQAALGQAISLNPAGIVIGGFDPKSTQAQIDQAAAANIPLIGWHALADPGPSTDPKLFTNVTISVDTVAKISAQAIIARSEGKAGVVVFTDNSIPFAAGKAKLIEQYLTECSTVTVLSEQNIPIPDAGTRTPQAFSSLVTTLGDTWTDSVAINDLYFDNAATPLRAAGRNGDGAPYNVGAGDGSPAAFQRISAKQFQSATVPDPLNQQGWQIIDEFNRAFAGEPATDYVPPVHITTTANVGSDASWDPDNGYRDVYKGIWGK